VAHQHQRDIVFLGVADQLEGAAADLALAFLTSSAKNSWLSMIQQGATATMEAWSPDEKPNLSFSHPWCSGPNSVIVRHLLGVAIDV
jgi:alpha-L-rhamnosidase